MRSHGLHFCTDAFIPNLAGACIGGKRPVHFEEDAATVEAVLWSLKKA